MRKKNRRKPSTLTRILVYGGVALLVIAILAFKGKRQDTGLVTSVNELPETQLDRAVAERRPVLAFIHSNNCQQCLEMIDTVAQVFPDFEDSIVLVDINVYDQANQALIERLSVKFIPTLVFYDQNGHAKAHVGVMGAAELSKTLTVLAGGK